MFVRKAKPEDAETIVQFQLKMAKETENMELDQDTVTKGVAAVFEDPKKGTYWVAEEHDMVIACLLTVPEWSDWRNGDVLWIHSVYVLNGMRERGVFSELYNAVKKEVESKEELKGIRLYVDKRNDKAQRVYEKVGMTDDHYTLFEWLQ